MRTSPRLRNRCSLFRAVATPSSPATRSARCCRGSNGRRCTRSLLNSLVLKSLLWQGGCCGGRRQGGGAGNGRYVYFPPLMFPIVLVLRRTPPHVSPSLTAGEPRPFNTARLRTRRRGAGLNGRHRDRDGARQRRSRQHLGAARRSRPASGPDSARVAPYDWGNAASKRRLHTLGPPPSTPHTPPIE